MNADITEESAAFVGIWKTLTLTSRQKTIEELLDRQTEAMVVHDRGSIFYANERAKGRIELRCIVWDGEEARLAVIREVPPGEIA